MGSYIISLMFRGHGSDIIRSSCNTANKTNVLDFDWFKNNPPLLAFGMVCALIGAGTWLVIASHLGMPVSTTHSIIGALLGVGLATGDLKTLRWSKIGMIVASWFIAPIFASISGGLIFFILRLIILRRVNSFKHATMILPVVLLLGCFCPFSFFLMFKNPFKSDHVCYMAEGKGYVNTSPCVWAKWAEAHKVLSSVIAFSIAVALWAVCLFLLLKLLKTRIKRYKSSNQFRTSLSSTSDDIQNEEGTIIDEYHDGITRTHVSAEHDKTVVAASRGFSYEKVDIREQKWLETDKESIAYRDTKDTEPDESTCAHKSERDKDNSISNSSMINQRLTSQTGTVHHSQFIHHDTMMEIVDITTTAVSSQERRLLTASFQSAHVMGRPRLDYSENNEREGISPLTIDLSSAAAEHCCDEQRDEVTRVLEDQYDNNLEMVAVREWTHNSLGVNDRSGSGSLTSLASFVTASDNSDEACVKEEEPVASTWRDRVRLTARDKWNNMPWFKDVHADLECEFDLGPKQEKFDEKTELCFSCYEIFSSSLSCLAHSANDTANAVGPFAAILTIYSKGLDESMVVDWYVLFCGGLSMAIGLALFGHRVIQTMGVKLVKITPTRGFPIELGAAWAVLLFSAFGFPLSTTHCAVGSTLGVGLLEPRKPTDPPPRFKFLSCLNEANVNWRLFGSVFISWIGTVLFSALVSMSLFSFGSYAPYIYGGWSPKV